MEGVIEQFVDDERALMRVTSCRNTEHIGRLIFADLNYWRKMNNEKENSNSNSIMRGMSGDTSEMSKDGVRQKYRDSER